MATLDEKKARVAELEQKISEHRDAIAVLKMNVEPLRQEIACADTGFNIADVVEWGKDRKGRVLQVSANRDGSLRRLLVQRILKDGSDGAQLHVDAWSRPRHAS